MNFIGDILRDAVRPDKNVTSVGLFTPSGDVLGYVHSSGKKPSPISDFDVRAISFSYPRISQSGFVFFTRVPASVEDCCECRAKRLASADGSYYYILRTEVSRQTLNERLASITNWLLFIGFLALILSAFVARIISRRLVHKLAWMGEKVEIITKSNNLSLRLQMPGHDEIAILAEKFDDMLEQLRISQSRLNSAEKEKALVGMAHQVAHDIRSPLAALEVVSGDVANLPEEKRILIRAAVGRIRDIANSLLNKHRSQSHGTEDTLDSKMLTSQLLSSLIDPVVSEKRLQFRSQSNVEIELQLNASSYGLFANVQPIEYKRLISNLVDNAIEAFGDGRGIVSVRLTSRDEYAVVSIQDNGQGIPSEVLAKLGQRGTTHGKSCGSGLGLHHARTAAESWGGSLGIVSKSGKGTTVTVVLPLAAVPEWFVPELCLSPRKTVVILDDDASIHQVWQGRFDALNTGACGIEIVHVSSPDEIRNWVGANKAKADCALYLFDYELLGYRETGLSLAEELRLSGHIILVTSRYEDPEILKKCLELKAQLIPKGLAGLVPIRIMTAPEQDTPKERLDAVLIDDDPLILMTWQVSASLLGKKLRTFDTSAKFLEEAHSIDHATPIFVDAELADGKKGDIESLKIHGLGFHKIFLTTGHAPEQFAGLTHLEGVLGKKPPWN